MSKQNGNNHRDLVKLGKFYIKHHGPDDPPYQVDMSTYSRPSFLPAGPGGPMGGMFNRERPANMKGVRDVPGFKHLDYAFDYGADLHNRGEYGWKSQGTGFMLGVGNVWSMGQWDHAKEGYSLEDTTNIVKKAAKFYGASASGVAMVDERWFYQKEMPRPRPKFPNPLEGPVKMPDPAEMRRDMKPIEVVFSDDTQDPSKLKDGKKIIPRSMKYLVVMALEMDGDAYSCETSALSMAGSLNGYSRMWFVATTLAEFIRALGYRAIPMGNDTALSQPMAVDAGLGEMSRAGLLITPKYGPRARLCKVLTDMPLIPDRPISFGVTEFCNVCGKCADRCPSNSIPMLEIPRSYDAPKSGNGGVLKWAANGQTCREFWMQNGAECHTCIRVCPFTKPDGWIHHTTKALVGLRSEALDKLLLLGDDLAGYGKKKGIDPREFWNMEDYIHVKE
jgi:reductive dehalogenase